MKQRKITPITFIASLLGIGFSPVMPGTFGSVGAYGLYLLLPAAFFAAYNGFLWLAILFALSLFAVYISGLAERNLGTDAPQIVIDELIGFFVASLFLPHNWLIGLYALVLFRVFDIAKPLFINRLQSLPGGWGVVADDVLAGIYANILMQVLIRIYPAFFKLNI